MKSIAGLLCIRNRFYPFGLTMSGISSKALAFGGTENKLRFNGYEQQNKEFSDGSGLEWYDYKNRFYDNQIGRFFVQDRLATDYVYYTPYQFAGNEVPNAIDLDGLEPLRNFPLPAGDNSKPYNPVASTFVKSPIDVNLHQSNNKIKSVKQSSIRIGGGLKLTSKFGQNEAIRATDPDPKSISIDLMVAAIGSVAKAKEWDLKEVSVDRALELASELVELKKDDDNKEFNQTETTDKYDRSSVLPMFKKKGNVVIYRESGRKIEIEDSTGSAHITDKTPTDTFPPRKNK